jgi:hypothetical protein
MQIIFLVFEWNQCSKSGRPKYKKIYIKYSNNYKSTVYIIKIKLRVYKGALETQVADRTVKGGD